MDMEPLRSKYVVGGEPIGSGTTGEVQRGRSESGQDVAIKLLRPELVASDKAYAGILQVVAALTALTGPNLVRVREPYTGSDTLAVVMDYVPGGDLAKFLAETGPMLPMEIARVGEGIASALALAHNSNVVHGDLKPSNVLMEGEGSSRVPKVTDFQIAWTVFGGPNPKSLPYTAPEVLIGGAATAASDVYSLGVVLYEMCCTVTPFASDLDRQVRFGHSSRAPGMPDGVPLELWNVISRMLAKLPAERPHATQVAEALHALVEPLSFHPAARRLTVPPEATSFGPVPVADSLPNAWPIPAPPSRRRTPMARRAAVVFGVVAVLGTAVWLFTGTGEQTEPVNSSTGATGPVATTTTAPQAQRSSAPPSPAELKTMPDLIGQSLGAARDVLPKSVRIETEEVLDTNTKNGTVLKQDPEPGAALGASVKLTVAQTYAIQYLDTMTPASGQWDRAEVAALAGAPVPHAVIDGLNRCTDLRTVEYALSRGYRKFTAKAGITDDSSDAALEVRLEVFADNRPVFEGMVRYNEIAAIDVDVTQVARLKFQWQPVPDKNTCGNGATLALGEAALLGIENQMPTSGTPRPSTAVTTTR